MSSGFPLRIRSASFDLDGTLLDTVGDLTEAAVRMAAELGEPPVSEAEVRCFVGKGIPNLVSRCLTRHGRTPGEAAERHAVAVFRRHYALVNGASSVLYPGVREGLDAFRAMGLPLAVVTNKAAEFTVPLLERTGLAAYFSVVVSGDTVAHKKPHPLPLTHACSVMGVAPGCNLHVGDSANDIVSARAAGSPVFCVPYGYNEGRPVDKADCDALVSSLAEAARLVRPA